MFADAARGTKEARAFVFTALPGIVLAVFLIGPRTAPFLVLLLTATVLIGATASAFPRIDRSASLWSTIPAPIAALFAMAGWALITVAWSADRTEAIGKVALLVLFTGAAWATAVMRTRIPDERLNDFARAALFAAAGALVFLLIEELTSHAIKRLLFTLLTWARPSAKHITLAQDSGEVMNIAAYISNRNMAAVSLALWPMLLVAWHVVGHEGTTSPPWKRWLILSTAIAVAAATMALSQHETSLLAIAGAVGALVLTLRFPRAGMGIVAAGWIVATLLVVPITDWAFRSGQLHQASWLPHTARQRIILWGYTAQQVQLRPLLGVGADSTKPLDAKRGPKVETPAGFSYQWRSGPHAHNIYLQTWYELGLPGAALLCAFGLLVLRRIWQLVHPARPLMNAAFVSAAITGAFTWGLWQAWFMGAFALSGIVCLLALEIQQRAAASYSLSWRARSA